LRKSLNLVTGIILFITFQFNPFFLLGQTAKIFAPGVVSLEDRVEFGCTFSPDGKEFYFSIEKPDKRLVIMVTKQEDNHWIQPQVAAFSGKYDDLEVSISPGGKRLFFCSNRPLTGNGEPKKDFDIWFVKKSAKGWGEPQHAGDNVNTDGYEWYPTASLNGTLYFCGGKTPGLYRSKLIDGKYTTPEKIGDLFTSDIIGGHPYIAPDESYIITSAKEAPGSKGGWDLYISFQKPDGSWTKSKNLGGKINTKENEDFPCVSPDGKYLFFTRLSRDSQGKEIGDIYEMMASVLLDMYRAGELTYDKKTGHLSRAQGSCHYCVNDLWQFPEGCPYGKDKEKPYEPGQLQQVKEKILEKARKIEKEKKEKKEH